MAKQTRAQQIIRMLEDERGCVEVIPSKSRKYRQFRIPDSNEFYWVGSMGALRRGANSTTSRSLTLQTRGITSKAPGIANKVSDELKKKI